MCIHRPRRLSPGGMHTDQLLVIHKLRPKTEHPSSGVDRQMKGGVPCVGDSEQKAVGRGEVVTVRLDRGVDV